MSRKSILSDEVKIDRVRTAPSHTKHELTLMHHAADMWGAAFNSDPHAANKAFNDMRMGYALRSDVVNDASNMLSARGEAKRAKAFSDSI